MRFLACKRRFIASLPMFRVFGCQVFNPILVNLSISTCPYTTGRLWVWISPEVEFQSVQLKIFPEFPAFHARLCVSDGATGELRITNHSQSLAGLYGCQASNSVGAERCRVVLKANKRKELKQDIPIHAATQDALTRAKTYISSF